eukprot:TRINITY_DN359_c0_g1_i10.p2 TRINITY_DN359_c0_g1~~TRINITY_DN359_c0_g1_i10.p2  ORF type:complete len:404 (-),score=69.21 TRINITY_DN359_c0_g1_i10:916-2055(-)
MVSIAFNSCLAVASGVEITAFLLKDFAGYLKNTEDEQNAVPQSVMKLCKILQSAECLNTCQGFISTGIDGFVESQMGKKMLEENSNKPGAVEKIVDALVSEPGQNLVALAVKMATRTAVETFSESVDLKEHIRSQNVIRQILEWLHTPKAQQFVSYTTQSTIATAVTSFMDSPKSQQTNPAENLLSALSKPQHAEVARQLLQALVREAITTSAIHIKSGQSSYNTTAMGYSSPLSSRTNSPLRDRRTLAIPDLQQVPQYYNYSKQQSQQQQSPIGEQITSGLASICGNRDARSLVKEVVGEVTSSGVRSSIYSVLDVIRGRGEFDYVFQQRNKGDAEQQRSKGKRISSGTMMSVLMALLLHVSIYPLPYVQLQQPICMH